MPGQPQATDFTEIVPSVTQDGKYVIRVILDSGQHVVVAMGLTIEAAERRELTINQAMIEYRAKRNAYEKRLRESLKEAACADPDFH